jgi:hypothetical protein
MSRLAAPMQLEYQTRFDWKTIVGQRSKMRGPYQGKLRAKKKPGG